MLAISWDPGYSDDEIEVVGSADFYHKLDCSSESFKLVAEISWDMISNYCKESVFPDQLVVVMQYRLPLILGWIDSRIRDDHSILKHQNCHVGSSILFYSYSLEILEI